jgi:hypothetical protein
VQEHGCSTITIQLQEELDKEKQDSVIINTDERPTVSHEINAGTGYQRPSDASKERENILTINMAYEYSIHNINQ